SITLQFDLNRNVDAAAQDVQAAITAAARQLPITLTAPPTYRKVNPADSPILILAAHSDTLPLTVVDDFADTVIAQRISQITGVAQVTIGGEQKPAIRVQVDPAKLQTRGLTFEDVRAVLGIAHINAAMPQLASVIPPGLQLDTIVDRTQTIRASVIDVEFTLALTIGLVVMVILVFLLDLRATLIPAITVPLSLLGAVAMMYLLG